MDAATIASLERLGLSSNEAILYRALLEKPKSTARELLSWAPFPRTMLYHVLNQLRTRGLVSVSRDTGVAHYVAEDPDHLYDMLAKREREVEVAFADVRDTIPQLKRVYRLAGKRPAVRIFEGVEAYQTVIDDMLSGVSEVRAYETFKAKKPGLESRASNEARRIRRKIRKHVLFFESKEALKFLAIRPYDDYTRFRCMREGDVAPFAADVALFDGRILYTTYQEYEPTAVLVEDQSLYIMQKNLFDSFWSRARERTLTYTEV